VILLFEEWQQCWNKDDNGMEGNFYYYTVAIIARILVYCVGETVEGHTIL
jgi:hypothetical protein